MGRCGWSDEYRECTCIDYPQPEGVAAGAAQPLDSDEQAFLHLHRLGAGDWESHCSAPGYFFKLAAKGGSWAATREPAHIDWPDTINDIHNKEYL
ncbi:hypothetical protein BG418_18340 [Streptomyces sp. CBMA152]|nr:hypothetical protein [Streptomyces sp. CBMA152]